MWFLKKTKNSISFIIFITLFIFSTLLTMMYTGCGDIKPTEPPIYHPYYSVSGIIKDTKNTPAGLTTVILVNSRIDTYMLTTTDNNGSYYFPISKEGKGENYIVTPVRANYSFSPTNTTINNLISDQTVNFIGTKFSSPVYYSISGIITDSTGTPMSNVIVHVYGHTNIITTTNTDNNGFYIFPDLPAGNYYTVQPYCVDHYFKPLQTRLFPLLSDQTANFIVGGRVFI